MYTCKWMISWLTTVTMLFSGCGTQQIQQIQIVKPVAVRELEFLVSDQFDQEVVRQADQFADRVQLLSGGRITIKVIAQVPSVKELSAGTYDFALLRNIQLAQASPPFSTLSLPFLYNGQMHMSSVLNSKEMLSRLQQKLEPFEILPLAAFYFGGSTLVSDQNKGGVPEDFKGRIAALRTNNTEKLLAFEVLGTRVLPYSQDSLADLLGVQVEILANDSRLPAELVTIDTVEVSVVQALQIPEDSRPLFMMSPGHMIAPVWLAANGRMWNGLSEWERSVILEAQAGLTAGLDNFFTARELAAIETLVKRGVAVTPMEREMIADLIYNRSEEYVLPEYFDYKLYQLTQLYG